MEFVKDVDQEAFGQEVLQRSHEVPVVVDFWAEWCGPCKVLGPVLESLAAEHDGQFELVKVDVDRNQELSAQFGIQGIPNVIGFRDGQPMTRFTGALPEPAVRQWLDELLPSEADALVDRARDAALEGSEGRAEDLYRMALDIASDHEEAGTGLASLLIARGETDEALVVLGRLSPTADVERLQATARVAAAQADDLGELASKADADPSDSGTLIELGRALAANQEYEPGLDQLLKAVALKDERLDEARQAMFDVFELLGDDHPLTLDYRKRLANQLF